MKIKTITLRDLRNDEHFQFFQFLINLVENTGAGTLKVEQQFAELVAMHRKEDDALRKINKSELTERINEADRARDQVFSSIAGTIKAGLAHYMPSSRESATHLQIVMDTYGNVAKMSQIEETSAIYNLTKELSKNTNHVMNLNLGGWIATLERLNSDVQTLLEERADESAARATLILKEARAQADTAYHTLAELIDAFATVARATGNTETAEMYGNFTGRLNQRIDMLNQTSARHHKHAAKTGDTNIITG